MKKFITLFLIFVMALGMVACAASSNTDTKRPADKDPGVGDSAGGSTPEETRPDYNLSFEEDYPYWGTTDEVGVPEIPQLVYQEKTVADKTGYVTETPFKFDRIAIENGAKANTHLRGMASNIYSYEAENHYGRDTTYNGYYTDQTTYSYVMGEDENGNAMFHLYATTDPMFYNGYSALHLRFECLGKNDDAQGIIYDAAKLVFGEYADFLVYGQDSNGVTYGKKPVEVDPLQIIDLVEHEDHTYKIVRTINERGKDQLVVDMFIEVFSNEKYTPHTTQWPSETVLFEDNAYTPSAIMSAGFGETYPTSRQFGLAGLSKFVSSYKDSKLEYWNVSEETYEDGTYSYNFAIKNRYYDAKDSLEGNIWYSIEVKKKGDETKSLTFNFSNHWGMDSIKTDSQEYIDNSIAMMEYLFEIEIPEIKHNGKFRNVVKVPLVIDGTEYTAEFDVNHNSGSCGISLMYLAAK